MGSTKLPTLKTSCRPALNVDVIAHPAMDVGSLSQLVHDFVARTLQPMSATLPEWPPVFNGLPPKF
jgi:hypothetical protein